MPAYHSIFNHNDNVSYYHGGDVLYTLYQYEHSGAKLRLPGMWHEALLIERRPSWQYVRASSVLEVIASTVKEQPVIIVRNKHSGLEYLMSRQDFAEQVANDMAVVFEARDAHNVALKYGFGLDFKPLPRVRSNKHMPKEK